MENEFEGKSVIVTGSSSGIGETVAVMFARQGASVTLCGRDNGRLQDVLDKCRQAGQGRGGGAADRYITVCGDINETATQDRIVQETKDTFGKIDVLVCNHGVFPVIEGVLESSPETYHTIMDTNLKSVYFLIQRAEPHLTQSKGNIVNVSSVVSEMTSKFTLPYALSKVGLDYLTKSLAINLAPKGVRVNAVNPTMVATRIGRDLPASVTGNRMTHTAGQLLEGRVFSTTEEQADAVLFLAGPRASFITGQCLKVDGGVSLVSVLSS